MFFLFIFYLHKERKKVVPVYNLRRSFWMSNKLTINCYFHEGKSLKKKVKIKWKDTWHLERCFVVAPGKCYSSPMYLYTVCIGD